MTKNNFRTICFVAFLTFAPSHFHTFLPLSLLTFAPSHLLMFSVPVAYAEVPNEITYTGRLNEFNKAATGTRTMNFRIYDAATNGTNVWSDDGVSISVKNGVFSYTLKPVNIDWRKKDYWLETNISGKILSPREKLTSQFYALHSRTAEDIEKSAGTIHFTIGSSTYASVSSNGLTVDGQIDFGDSTVNIRENAGRVEISTKAYAQEYESSYGFYHDRGYFETIDFTQASLTMDNDWHDLDLSTIVPAGTKTLLLRVWFTDDQANNILAFKKKGAINDISNNVSAIVTQVVNVSISSDLIVSCDSNRKIQYRISYNATEVSINVAGWWK